MQLSSLLRKPRTSFPPPSSEERKATIAAIKWGLFDHFGYAPHDPQIDCHISDARYRMWIAGTRGGKSLGAAEEATIYMMAGATRGWIVGQNYSLTEKEFRYMYERMVSQEMHDLFGETPLESCTYNESQGSMHMRTKWGSWVRCISLERPAGAFGEELDWIIMSEAAQIKRPRLIYDRILRGRLSSRLGDMIIPTTPAGKMSEHDPDGWLHEMYLKGYNPDEPNYFTREWPSWANPHWPEDPYELRRELDPRIFAEQYEGKFVVFTGAIYTNYDERVHVIPFFNIPLHWHRYEAIDPGFRGEFAWVAGVMSEQGNFYITNEYDDQETSYEDRVGYIKDKRCEEYGIEGGWVNQKERVHRWDQFASKNHIRITTFIDPEDPQCAMEFTKLGLPCQNQITNRNVMVGIDRVQRRLKFAGTYAPTLYITMNCPKVQECFLSHSWGDKTSEIRKPANDPWKHKMDCVRYICAGNLVASPPAIMEEPNGYLYDMLLELQSGARGKHPHDMTMADRRGY